MEQVSSFLEETELYPAWRGLPCLLAADAIALILASSEEALWSVAGILSPTQLIPSSAFPREMGALGWAATDLQLTFISPSLEQLYQLYHCTHTHTRF